MSKKSRARTQARRAERQPVDCLELQKQNIQGLATEPLVSTAFFLIMAVLSAVLFFLADLSLIAVLLFIFFGGLTIYCGILAVQQLRIAHVYQPIAFASEEEIVFHCRKVSFHERNISRFHSVIACVIFHATDGRKFYYVYPQKGGISPLAVKNIKSLYTDRENVRLVVYKGTCAVKLECKTN